MTFEDIITDFTLAEDLPEAAMEALANHWDAYGPRCRALLHGYISGADISEQTELALFYIVHVMGEMADTASFPALCTLALDTDRLDSILGEDGAALSYSAILLSTFDGDPAPLHRLIEHATADEMARGDALLVLAYLVRTGRMPQQEVYDYLAGLPARLQPQQEHDVWFGYARAVAVLGFAGLSAAVEASIGQGFVSPALLTSADFWADLRAAQQDELDFFHPAWASLAPIGSAVDHLRMTYDGGDMERPDSLYIPQEPIRNPLRNVGRNDPCPCGSGNKFKKCCLGTV